MPDQPTEESWQLFVAIAARIDAAVVALPPREPTTSKLPDIFIQSMFWRSIRLYRASLHLLKVDLPWEALIVARSLFVDSLRLLQFADAGGDRAALVLGWANWSVEEEKGLIRDARRVGLEGDAERLLQSLDTQQAKLLKHKSKLGVTKLAKFLSEAAASQKFGRGEDFWTYCLAHEMVHGSDVALKVSRKRLAPDTYVAYLGNHDPALLVGVGLFVARSSLDAAESTAGILQWPGREQFSELRHALEALQVC